MEVRRVEVGAALGEAPDFNGDDLFVGIEIEDNPRGDFLRLLDRGIVQGEWSASIQRSFPQWDVRLSSRLTDSEYAAGEALVALQARPNTKTDDRLHLSVSMRSFRAEHVSLFVKQLLDGDVAGARTSLASLKDKFPIVLARSLPEARDWLRRQARGSERYGILVSSQAYRLKPHAIEVRAQVDPVHWFLDGKDDVRSSYYLEDAATEFQVQGLELDWACVTWDGDFRFVPDSLATPAKGHWEHWSFVENAWQRVKKAERQRYLKNAYRVLLTRARQGMVIVVPEGDFWGWSSRAAVPRLGAGKPHSVTKIQSVIHSLEARDTICR